MSIKVIIMDVDGTMVNNKKQITPKTKEALLRAEKAGVRLVIASGRPTPGLYRFARELQMDKYRGLLVSYNGAKVTACDTGNVLFNEALTVEQGKAVLHHMKNFDRVRPMIDLDDYLYVQNVYDHMITWKGKPLNVIEYEARGGNFKLCEIDDLEEFADFPLNKILTASDPEYLQEHYQEMAEPFKDTLNCMFTSDFFFEFTAKGIDKAKALQSVLLPMGYTPEQMIAFGDAQNDSTMLKFVGTGVAMGNASDEVKALADEVTLTNEEDGIAVALAKHFGWDD